MLSAAQWNLLRGDPTKLLAVHTSLVACGSRTDWRGLTGRRRPITCDRFNPTPVLAFNPVISDRAIRQLRAVVVEG